MELRQFAERIVFSESLEEKLAPPPVSLSDSAPGASRRPSAPGRPAKLVFAPRRTANQPRPAAFGDPRKRALAHHIMANHELQAIGHGVRAAGVSRGAAGFRQGLVDVIRDEQRHTRMHSDRAAELGTPFGSLPVNCYIWKKAQSYHCVLDYLAGLPLTFEGCNLDHTL
jgi:uncharacterized ferritin-like protein (DUF455 family)